MAQLQISCLHPYAKKVPEDRNDASLVLRLSQGDFQMLLTGDLEKSGEDWLVEQVRPAVEQPQPVAQEQALPCVPSTRPAGQGQALPCAPSTRPAGQEQALPCAPSTQSAAQNSLRCTILDAGHHGASNATGEALLDLAQPELVLISCGKNNRYGHPGAGNVETPGRAGDPLVFHGGGRRDTGACWKEKSENRNKADWTKTSHIELKNTKKRLCNKRGKDCRKSKINYKTNRNTHLNEF